MMINHTDLFCNIICEDKFGSDCVQLSLFPSVFNIDIFFVTKNKYFKELILRYKKMVNKSLKSYSINKRCIQP